MTAIPQIRKKVLVYGWLAIVLRQSGDAFLIQFLGEDDKPRGGVQWHHISHLRVYKKDC